MTNTWRPTAIDANNNPIAGIRKLEAITNTSVASSAYTAINVPTGVYCKGVAASLRSPGATFKVATSASGSTFYTIAGTLELDVCAVPGERLFYVSTASSADVFEVMFLG